MASQIIVKGDEHGLGKKKNLHIDHWKEIARAHGEVFGEIRPATSMVEIKRLIDPDMLVEIEAEAIVDESEDL